MAERTSLWGTIDKWMVSQRVSITNVSDHGGVARNTLNLIRLGTTSALLPETARKISRGLASDPKTGKLDRPLYIAILQDICKSAGLPDLTQDIPPCDLEDEINAVVKDRSRASVLALFVRKYPDMAPGERRLVDSLLDSLGNSK